MKWARMNSLKDGGTPTTKIIRRRWQNKQHQRREKLRWTKVPRHKSVQTTIVSKKTNDTIPASLNKYANPHDLVINKVDKYWEHTTSIDEQCNNNNSNIIQSKQQQSKKNKQQFKQQRHAMEKEERKQHKQ